jgi:RHH-type rel operon transcriptional repressor/antitoxin RelB
MPLSVRLTPDEEARLDALAARTGRKTFYVREAIEAHLDELEERCWADEVVRGWETSGKPSRPAIELWDELGVGPDGSSRRRRSSIRLRASSIARCFGASRRISTRCASSKTHGYTAKA